MESNKNRYNPFVRKNDSVHKVIADVIIALLPSIAVSILAYGFYPIAVVLVAVGSSLIAEYLFSAIFCRNKESIGDGSAIITGILLAFTVGPFTPLHVVAFGGVSAVIFGKMLWGGVGRNRFNPALVGREFMTIFFPVIMSSNYIWKNKALLNIPEADFFNNEILNHLFFKASGSIGEYSPLLLILGGIYLLLRRRISWHIPVGMLTAFIILLLCFWNRDLSFSFGGLFLGAIYMATDMPTSATPPMGKLYFGVMVGIVCVLCLVGGVANGYFSYAILIMNGFVQLINWAFRSRVWGKELKMITRVWQSILLTIAVLATTFIVILLDQREWIKYLIYFFILYTIGRFIWQYFQKENKFESYHFT